MRQNHLESLSLAELPFLTCDFQRHFWAPDPTGRQSIIVDKTKSDHWVKQCKKFMAQKKEYSFFNPQVQRNAKFIWDQIQKPRKNLIVSPKCRLKHANFFGMIILKKNTIECTPKPESKVWIETPIPQQGYQIERYAFLDVNHDGIMDVILDIWELNDYMQGTGDAILVLTKTSPTQKGFTRLFFEDYQSPIEYDRKSILKAVQ